VGPENTTEGAWKSPEDLLIRFTYYKKKWKRKNINKTDLGNYKNIKQCNIINNIVYYYLKYAICIKKNKNFIFIFI